MNPSKIVCVHLNYRSRVEEFGARLPKAPTYFLKPPSALIRSGEPVVRPQGCRYLNFEGEIVAVIGARCRGIEPEDAGRFVAGYTIGNDFGLHDFRDTDAGSMLRVKGADTLCPVVHEVVSGWDFRGRNIRTLVNGEVRQSGNTDEMAWDPHYLVADVSRTHTLLPGDLVFTGTPAGSRPVEPGDEVAVEVEGLGRLVNPVVAGEMSIPRRLRRATDRIRRGALDRARRRLGVPGDSRPAGGGAMSKPQTPPPPDRAHRLEASGTYDGRRSRTALHARRGVRGVRPPVRRHPSHPAPGAPERRRRRGCLGGRAGAHRRRRLFAVHLQRTR